MKTLAVAAVAALTLGGAAAHAAEYTYEFTGGGEVFAGSLTTSSSGDAQQIATLTGTLNGAEVTLAPAGTIMFQPTNDNVVYPGHTGMGFKNGSSGYLDAGGLAFYSGADVYNLIYNQDSTTIGYQLDNDSTLVNKDGNFVLTPNSAISAAPEPSTWALMLAGVAMIGGVLRIGRRNRTLAVT